MKRTFGGGDTFPLYDAFVTKINPSGSGVVYSTYLGGGGSDVADAIKVDSSGNAYVAGRTYSSNFPVTASAFQRSLNLGLFCNECEDEIPAQSSTRV